MCVHENLTNQMYIQITNAHEQFYLVLTVYPPVTKLHSFYRILCYFRPDHPSHATLNQLNQNISNVDNCPLRGQAMNSSFILLNAFHAFYIHGAISRINEPIPALFLLITMLHKC